MKLTQTAIDFMEEHGAQIWQEDLMPRKTDAGQWIGRIAHFSQDGTHLTTTLHPLSPDAGEWTFAAIRTKLQSIQDGSLPAFIEYETGESE